MNDGIMENYGNIQDLYSKLLLLTERIIKLEEIIVELANTGMWDKYPIEGKVEYEGTPILEPEEDIDWAEIAQQRRDNEEGWRDR